MTTLYQKLIQLAGPIERGDSKATAEAIRLIAAAGVPAGEPKAISGDVSIGPTNFQEFDGRTLNFSTAATVTILANIPIPNFGFAFTPPASGNASFAATGVTLNGAGTTLTRAASGNSQVMALTASGVNAYAVTGS